MRFTGTITATALPACTNPAPPFEIYVNGNRFEALGNLGGAGVGWFIGPISGQGEFVNSWMFFPDIPSDSGVALWSPDLSDRNGEIIFRRDPLYAACSGSPAYQLSGTQQVQVDFVTVDVGASKTKIQANEAVTFTANPINFVPTDPNAVYWSFYTEANPSAPINVASCSGQQMCTYTPPARGRMSASIPISEGFVPGFSVIIEFLCPTGDSILDSEAMRNLLKMAWDSSNAFDPVKLNRRERGGFVIRNASGNLTFRTSFAPSDGPCKSANALPPGVSPGSVVAEAHSHPFSGDTLGTGRGEETTGICSTAVAGTHKYYDATTLGGPSEPDFNRGTDDNVPMYVIDKDNIYSFSSGDDRKELENQAQEVSQN